MKNYRYYSIITGLFVACLLISNVLDAKIFSFVGFSFPAGILLFPIVYLFGDVFTEVYGYSYSRKAIWTGFTSLTLAVVFFKICEWIPAASFWEYQEDYEHILGKVPRIAMASIAAYFFGEFTNSVVLSKLKVKTKGRGMSFRFVVSTIFGEAVDTLVFIAIAFVGTIPLSSLGMMFLSGWLFKVVWEILALPLTVPFVKWLKRKEGVDIYDENVDYNPFKVK